MSFKEIFHFLFSWELVLEFIFWSKFFENYSLETKVKPIGEIQTQKILESLFLENSRYYNQLYDFISGYSEKPNNEEYIRESKY